MSAAQEGAGREAAGIVKRSLTIAGHRTSISLEAPFWDALKALAAARGLSVQALVGAIDAERAQGDARANLSSAIRVHVLRDAMRAAGREVG